MAVTGSTLLTLQNLSYYDSRLKKWVGQNLEDSLFVSTDSATYHAMAELGQTDDIFLYFLTDTGEIYKGGICYGKSSDLDEATLALLSTKEKDGEKILLFNGKEIKGGGGMVLTEEAYNALKEAGKVEEATPYFISDTKKILINDICINIPNNKKGVSDAISLLSTEDTTPTDNDYIIAQESGGQSNIYYRKTLGTLWKWIKSKVETLGYATETWVANKGYTTNTGTVTAIKINGSTKDPSDGVVDLGTISSSPVIPTAQPALQPGAIWLVR